MCGICGFVQSGAPAAHALGQRMLDTLAHRGPDDEGIIVRSNGARHALLAGRRLAIIDLSPAAHQPFTSDDESVAVVFNGEIYNHPELREELRARSHRFRSRSDTEVILRGYEEFGPEITARLDGMFAFALWDDRSRTLLLARDRWGKKPLYYFTSDDFVVFGSEIKALLAHPGVPVEADASVVPEYLVHGYVSGGRTFYRDIREVPPATWIEFHEGEQRARPYWSLRFPAQGEERKISQAEAAEEVRLLLAEGVRKRLISDVPLGALLSGGLDSSAVVQLMAEVTNGPVRTFTAGFLDDSSYDERPYARAIVERSRTQHTEFMTTSADAGALVERLLWHHDQPSADSSAIPTYLISGVTRQAVTVALVGDGGDEIFAGYDRFRAALLADRIPEFAAVPVGAVLQRLPRGVGYHSPLTRLRRFGRGIGEQPARRYLEWVSVIPPRMAERILAPELAPGVGAVVSRVETLTAGADGAHPLHRLMHLNLRTYLAGDLLVKMDRMSMAQSLETRSPFLDVQLAEFVASLPAGYLIAGGRQKALLRRAFAGTLPSQILHRAKHGFGVPIDHWMRNALTARLNDELLAPDARIQSLVRPEEVRRLVDEHRTGVETHGHRLWGLLNLEIWLRQYRVWPRQAGRDA